MHSNKKVCKQAAVVEATVTFLICSFICIASANGLPLFAKKKGYPEGGHRKQEDEEEDEKKENCTQKCTYNGLN